MNKQLTTITFLSCIREAINLSVESMEGLKESTKSSFSDFIVNEASDYEVLNFAYTGKFPSEKYNIESENNLIEAIKFELDSNSFDFIESGIFTEDSITELTESLVPLSEFGLSSSRAILEYMDNTGLLIPLLKEKSRSGAWVGGGSKFDDWSKPAKKNKPVHMTSPPHEKSIKPVHMPSPPIKSIQSPSVKHTSLGMKAKKLIGNNKLSAAVGVGALLYGAYKTYKRFFSKAARACSDLSGDGKTACMEKYKKTAIRAQIADLKKAKVACKNSSNPNKCELSIDTKIEKLENKLIT